MSLCPVENVIRTRQFLLQPPTLYQNLLYAVSLLAHAAHIFISLSLATNSRRLVSGYNTSVVMLKPTSSSIHRLSIFLERISS